MELSILNMAGKETGKKIALNDAIFGIEPNDHAIYLDVKQFLAANRQGTNLRQNSVLRTLTRLANLVVRKVAAVPVRVI